MFKGKINKKQSRKKLPDVGQGRCRKGEEWIMGLVIKSNLPSMQALNQLNQNSGIVVKEDKRLSTGLKVNGAGDDASGYVISENMDVQVRSLDQDSQNVQNGQNILKTASGAVEESISILTTMKERAISAANDDKSDADRAIIQTEFEQFIDQIDMNSITTYNGKYLIDGSRMRASVGAATHLTNQSLSTDTVRGTQLVQLQSRWGEPLGIQKTDMLTVSWVKDGETKHMTVQPLVTVSYPGGVWTERPLTLAGIFNLVAGQSDGVTGDTLGGDVALQSVDYTIGTDGTNSTVTTADGKNAVTLVAKEKGVENQIAGITFSVYNSDGQPRTGVNAVLDAFNETIRAEDEAEDNAMVFQIGAKANQALKISLTDTGAVALGLVSSTSGHDKFLSVETQKNANAAINVLDSALKKLVDLQTDIGATVSRLEFTDVTLTVSSENTQASMSTIRDADMAKEMTEYARGNVLMQAAQAMLAQANQNSSNVIGLLQ